jgi:hypothetical protein
MRKNDAVKLVCFRFSARKVISEVISEKKHRMALLAHLIIKFAGIPHLSLARYEHGGIRFAGFQTECRRRWPAQRSIAALRSVSVEPVFG